MLELATLLTFAAAGLGSLAVLLLMRDLAAAAMGNSPVRVRRRFTIADEAPAASLAGRIGQSFDLLVYESGIGAGPATVALLLLAAGLTAGGAAWSVWFSPLPAVWCGLAGAMLPLLVLSVMRMRRMSALREQLPAVFDLLARAVRAGETLEQAIDLVAREAQGPLGSEFQVCSRQLALGMPVSTALRALAGRVRLMELRILATTLAVHRKAGGHLGETLERLTDVVRDRLNFRRQMRALTGAARFSAMLIASAGPLLFLALLVLYPAQIRLLLEPGLAQSLFVVAAVLEVVGIVWVLRLIRSEA